MSHTRQVGLQVGMVYLLVLVPQERELVAAGEPRGC